jgi:hypothetical protein
MIETYYDTLNEDEITFLKKECDLFIADDVPNESLDKKNYYFRKNIPDNKIFSFYEKILNKLYYKKNIKYHISGIWINKINSESNKTDKYHNDICDLTILIFLNDNFTGGEFEYIDGGEFEYIDDKKNIKIKPKKNKAIVIDNTLFHRVLPVLYGERFTLVCFFEIVKKENKSLI